MNTTHVIIASVVTSALVGALTTLGVMKWVLEPEPTQNELIRDFYLTENAVHVSPHSLRGQMTKGGGNFVLVDLRSPQEYEKEHIIGAVNIPAYTDPNTSAYQEVDRIVSSFKTLIQENPKKDIVVYCYSTPCMTGRKIGTTLVEHDIYVKHLGIGWNEWRYSWNMWNHDGETPTAVEDYISSGSEPGVPKATQLPSPCGEGEFGC